MVAEPTSYQAVADQSLISHWRVANWSMILNYMKSPTDRKLNVNRSPNFWRLAGMRSENARRLIGDLSAIISVVEMWLHWSLRPQTSSVAKRLRGGRKLCGTEALALVLGYLRSRWDHYYSLSGSGVKYFKNLSYKDECGGHVCIVTWTIRTRSTIMMSPHIKFGPSCPVLSENMFE